MVVVRPDGEAGIMKLHFVCKLIQGTIMAWRGSRLQSILSNRMLIPVPFVAPHTGNVSLGRSPQLATKRPLTQIAHSLSIFVQAAFCLGHGLLILRCNGKNEK